MIISKYILVWGKKAEMRDTMNKKVETRSIQLSILEIFKEVIKVCEKNEIEYFIVGGTVLGAIRHKGFIPWDDDLDIGMTRDNYNKFMDVVKTQLPDNLFFQHFYSEPNTPFYFSKVRKNNTKFIEYYARNIEMHHGVYIDIFPYDNLPDCLSLRQKQLNKISLWLNLYIAKSIKGSSVPQNTLIGKLKVSVRNIFHYLLKPISKDYLFQKVDKIAQLYNDEETKELSYMKEPLMALKNKNVKNLIEVEFEKIMVKCPNHPSEHLTNQYGNYSEYPPVKERVGHRPFKVEL